MDWQPSKWVYMCVEHRILSARKKRQIAVFGRQGAGGQNIKHMNARSLPSWWFALKIFPQFAPSIDYGRKRVRGQ
jgi:hypothetical protein